MSEENNPLSLRQVYLAFPVLRKLSSQELPARSAFRLTKLVRKANAEYKAVEEQRTILVKKYSTEDEDGAEKLNVAEENLDDFYKELNELLDEDSEVKVGNKFSIEDFGNAMLSVEECAAIEWLYDEGLEEEGN